MVQDFYYFIYFYLIFIFVNFLQSSRQIPGTPFSMLLPSVLPQGVFKRTVSDDEVYKTVLIVFVSVFNFIMNFKNFPI